MKKLIQITLLVVAVSTQSILQAQIAPNNYWEKRDSVSGLASDIVNDVLIETKSRIWIGTNRGLSFYDGNSFTNYTSSNSGLAQNNVRELTLAQGKLWMITDNGLSSFNDTSFTNYTTAQGLVSNVIAEITASSTDTLWIGTTSGVSKFGGTTFINYNNIKGRSIEVDSMDRVYVLKSSVIDRFPFAHIYENGSWSSPATTGDSLRISAAQLVLTKDGELYGVSKTHTDTYVKITYPLALKRHDVLVNGEPSPTTYGAAIMKAFEIKDGKLWVGSSNIHNDFFLSGVDSMLMNHFVSKLSVFASSIDIYQDLVVVGTDDGIYIANTNVQGFALNRLSISTNQIKTSVSTTDALFSDIVNNRSNFEFPKGSGSHGIYASNFIVAAKKAIQSNYEVHPKQGWAPSFIPGPIRNIAGVAKEYMLKISQQEIDVHKLNFMQPSYSLPNGIENWPAYGDTTLGIAKDLAPFVDVNQNGCYDPTNGDYPIIKGDEAIYWINHPANANLKLEYHWMMYAFNSPAKQYLNQSLFVQYTIINRDVSTYDSIKVGMYVDADLGNPSDDYVGSDSLNNTFYFYNGDLFDENFQGVPGYGNNTPALGVKFLSDSLTNLIYYNNGSGNNGDPLTAQHWVNYMNSRWKDGQTLKYGGNGYNSPDVTTIPTKYMLNGNPYTQNGWSEMNPGPTEQRHSPGDRRLFGSMPYFSLQANERKTIEVVVGYGMTPDTTTQVGQNIAEMISVLNASEGYNDSISLPNSDFATTDSCNLLTPVSEIVNKQQSDLRFFPNPTDGAINIISNQNIVQLELYDMKGSKISAVTLASKTYKLNLEGLHEGIYIIRILAKNGKWTSEKIVLR